MILHGNHDKSPNHSPQLQDGLYAAVSILKPKSIYFILLLKMVKGQHCQKNKILPGSHRISILISDATDPTRPCKLRPPQPTHSHFHVRSECHSCGAILSLPDSLFTQPDSWKLLFGTQVLTHPLGTSSSVTPGSLTSL